MKLFDDIKYNLETTKETRNILNEQFITGGQPVANSKCKYLGGHPDLLEKTTGDILVNSSGVLFTNANVYLSFFIPVKDIVKAEFKTGEQASKNEFFSRLLALNGFLFAKKSKTRSKLMYLSITFTINDIENTILFEAMSAIKVATAIAQIQQESVHKTFSVISTTVSDIIKEISNLRALGMISEEEFAAKKRDLLSRI